MRLNVCCGRHILEGWTNIDVVATTHKKAHGKVPEILADARDIPLDDGVAEEVMAIHCAEHFYPWEVDELLIEWRRLLKPRGRLVVEMPNVLKCCEHVLSGFQVAGKHPDQMSYWGLYGDPSTKDPLMMHKYGWHPKTFRAMLKKHDFTDITDEMPQWHASGSLVRDFRMTARKPVSG